MKTLILHSLDETPWIETGTYMGDTTKYLSKRYPKVITIEPSQKFFEFSNSRFSKSKSIEILHGSSEEKFDEALKSLKSKVNVWLDGHYSEGETFLGKEITPVLYELACISHNLDRFNEIVIFIDDVRLFPRYKENNTGYPELQKIISWCEANSFDWNIQNDIFIAKYSN